MKEETNDHYLFLYRMIHVNSFHDHMIGSNKSLVLLADNVYREVDALWHETLFLLDLMATEGNITLQYVDDRFRTHRDWSGVVFFLAYLCIFVLMHVSNFFEKRHSVRVSQIVMSISTL